MVINKEKDKFQSIHVNMSIILMCVLTDHSIQGIYLKELVGKGWGLGAEARYGMLWSVSILGDVRTLG